MGCCLSKTDPTSPSPPLSNSTPNPDPGPKRVSAQVAQKKSEAASAEKNTNQREEKKKEEREKEGEKADVLKKKEVFVIQHRKSNDKRSDSENGSSGSARPDPNNGVEIGLGSNIMAAAASGQPVRTSSCTKEEVDAILIQCGRLSRSSSGNVGNGRKYSGSKRSFDFDKENEAINGGDATIHNSNSSNGEEDERLRRRQSRGSHRRRSTPSRSRERGDGHQSGQRSGSRERERGDGSRRVSRSPGRRSESPLPSSNANANTNGSSNNSRPGKLVSVPAVEKGSSHGNGGGDVKRVLVKRNVGSPRSMSPARGNGHGGSQSQNQQPASLSRNGSRKAEHSPYRRTPLNEIDMNSLPFQPLPNKRPVSRGKEVDEDVVGMVVKQPLNSASQNKYADTQSSKGGGHRRTRSRGGDGYEISKTNYCKVNELQTPKAEHLIEHKGERVNEAEYDAMVTPVILAGSETLKLPQTLMRSRSSRRSRDLDINVDALITPTPATDYNSLLLQDIQNFHQSNSSSSNSNSNSNSNMNGAPFSLPPCVTKACSILEAVADLNSSTSGIPSKVDTNFASKRKVEAKDPFVESEVKVGDDLIEPSFHKYVTVRKRGGEADGEESSGSNSFINGAQNWVSSSSFEPNSADSTDCWTSKSYSREEGYSPVGFQRHVISDLGFGIDEGSEKKFSKNSMERFDQNHQIGAARGRKLQACNKAAAASM